MYFKAGNFCGIKFSRYFNFTVCLNIFWISHRFNFVVQPKYYISRHFNSEPTTEHSENFHSEPTTGFTNLLT